MIYKFTNARGCVNHGLIVEQTATGYYVLFDVFDVSARVRLPARYAFVAQEPNPYTRPSNARREILPIDTPIRWADARIAKVAGLVRNQQGDFAQWWIANRAEVTTGLIR